jgi:hypothetical protein
MSELSDLSINKEGLICETRNNATGYNHAYTAFGVD